MPTTELKEQIDAAFDFRGDVTLTLKDGTEIVGFLGNRDFAPDSSLNAEPFVEVYVPTGERSKPSGAPQRLLISTLASIVLTGTDHAAPSAD